MRPRLAPLLLTLPAVLAAPAAARELPTPVRAGETVYAAIDPAGEADEFTVVLFPGDRLQVKMRDQGPVRGLLSTLALAKPDGGAAAPEFVANGTTRSALSYTATDAGAHVLRLVGGPGEFTGAYGNYSAQVLVKRAKAPKGTFAEPAGGAISHSFGATEGAKVTLAAVTKKGTLALTELRRPDGSPEPGFAAALQAAKNGRSAALRSFTLTGGDGLYELRGTYAAGASVAVTASVKPAEKPRRRNLGAEPKFDRLILPFPSAGIVGTLVHVVGTDFTYVDVANGDDVYPRFFVGPFEVPRASMERPNGSLYRFPAPAGLAVGTTYDIRIVNADGQEALAEDAFTVVPPPSAATIAAIDGGAVAAGPAGGRRLRITGTDFRSGSVVLFGTTIAQPSVVLPQRIDVMAPAHAAGNVSVVVRDEFGQTSQLPGSFTYLDIPTNRLASLDRAFLQALGGETVTATGTDLGTDSVLTFDGADAGASRLSSTQMRFVAPSRAEGAATVRVSDTYEQTSSLTVPVRGFVDQSSTHVPQPRNVAGSLDGWRATRVVSGDVSGDNRPDLVLLQSTKALAGTAQRSRVRVLTQNPNGSFQDVTANVIPAVASDEDWRARDAVLADLDGDTDLDLAIVTPDDVNTGTRSSLRLLRNDGTGVFTDSTSAWAPALTSYGDRNQGVALAAADIDDDGDTDLVLSHTSYFTETIVTVIQEEDPNAIPPKPRIEQTTYNHFPATRVLRNAGNGVLTRSASAMPAVLDTDAHQFQADTVAAGDVTGDGVADVILTRDSVLEHPAGSGTFLRTAVLLVNSGAGVLSDDSDSLPAASDPEYLQADRVVLADADGDGDLDVFLVSNTRLGSPSTGQPASTPSLRLLVNASGTFTAAANAFPAVSGNEALQAEDVAVGDLDGDTKADVVLVSTAAPSSGGRACRVLRRSGSAWVSASVAMPNPATGDDGRGTDVTLLDLGGDGDLDVIVARDEADETVRNLRLFFNPRN